jgi:hypothetical protein
MLQVARKRLACVEPEVGDCMDGGTVYVEDGDLRDGTLVEEELGLTVGETRALRSALKPVAVKFKVRAVRPTSRLLI